MANPHELLKTCTRKEQQPVQAIFFIVRSKKLKNIEKIFEVTKEFIKKDRKDAKREAEQRFVK